MLNIINQNSYLSHFNKIKRVYMSLALFLPSPHYGQNPSNLSGYELKVAEFGNAVLGDQLRNRRIAVAEPSEEFRDTRGCL
jgi:hypothetical protein